MFCLVTQFSGSLKSFGQNLASVHCAELLANDHYTLVLLVEMTTVFFLLKAHYSKTCLKWPLSKRQKIGFEDQ